MLHFRPNACRECFFIATGATTATKASAQTIGPDQELIDLFDRWLKLERAILDATEKSDRAVIAACKEHPDQPACLKSGHAHSRGKAVSRDDIEWNHEFVRRLYLSSTYGVLEAAHKEIVKIYDTWEVEKDQINQRHNVPALLQALPILLQNKT